NCKTMKWATCDGTPCSCFLLTGTDNFKQSLNCQKIPKCFLMQAEMNRARKGEDTRTIGGKPVESAFVDNDGIYDPVCERDGKFKAKQCNNTEECWCVNSAGVRRTDKGDKNTINCTELVETWIRLELTHAKVNAKVEESSLKAINEAIKTRYNFKVDLVKEIQYDPDAGLIVVDVKKEKSDRMTDLATMAYYMEKDVKILPLFEDQEKFAPKVGSQTLNMTNIKIYYVDEKPPTFTMKNLSGGIIAVIVVVVLAVVIGLLALFFIGRRQKRKYSKTQ
uniref:Epithelial cell adhesion molecule n=1 Tax=Kryptolebias marmoratus TaxID=37003 RepID=A0A3Q3FRA5_KRYMA